MDDLWFAQNSTLVKRFCPSEMNTKENHLDVSFLFKRLEYLQNGAYSIALNVVDISSWALGIRVRCTCIYGNITRTMPHRNMESRLEFAFKKTKRNIQSPHSSPLIFI